jgi:hypothetical protein
LNFGVNKKEDLAAVKLGNARRVVDKKIQIIKEI